MDLFIFITCSFVVLVNIGMIFYIWNKDKKFSWFNVIAAAPCLWAAFLYFERVFG